MAPITGLSVRQYKRETVRLPVRFVVAEAHQDQVRFTTSSSALDQRSMFGVATDLSHGGLGLECHLFLPRMSEGTVYIYNPTRHSGDAEQLLTQEHVIEARVKVRRVVLASHEPLYSVGMSFVDPPEELNQLISELCAKADASAIADDEHGEGPADA